MESVGNALLERSVLFEKQTVEAFERLAQTQKNFGQEVIRLTQTECQKTQGSCENALQKMNENLTDLLAPILEGVSAVDKHKQEINEVRQGMQALQQELGGTMKVLVDRDKGLSMLGNTGGDATMSPRCLFRMHFRMYQKWISRDLTKQCMM